MGSKIVERVVKHPNLHLAVGGKLQHVPKGSKVKVTEDQAKRLNSKLEDDNAKAPVEVSSGGESSGDGTKTKAS